MDAAIGSRSYPSRLHITDNFGTYPAIAIIGSVQLARHPTSLISTGKDVSRNRIVDDNLRKRCRTSQTLNLVDKLDPDRSVD